MGYYVLPKELPRGSCARVLCKRCARQFCVVQALCKRCARQFLDKQFFRQHIVIDPSVSKSLVFVTDQLRPESSLK